MKTGKMLEVWIGDYSILVWCPADKTPKEIIKETVSSSISQYGLKVVNA